MTFQELADRAVVMIAERWYVVLVLIVFVIWVWKTK